MFIQLVLTEMSLSWPLCQGGSRQSEAHHALFVREHETLSPGAQPVTLHRPGHLSTWRASHFQRYITWSHINTPHISLPYPQRYITWSNIHTPHISLHYPERYITWSHIHTHHISLQVYYLIIHTPTHDPHLSAKRRPICRFKKKLSGLRACGTFTLESEISLACTTPPQKKKKRRKKKKKIPLGPLTDFCWKTIEVTCIDRKRVRLERVWKVYRLYEKDVYLSLKDLHTKWWLCTASGAYTYCHKLQYNHVHSSTGSSHCVHCVPSRPTLCPSPSFR